MEELFYSLHQSAKNTKDGISGVARKMGMMEKTLHSKLSPNDETHMPSMPEFVRILNCLDDLEPLDILCAMFGGAFTTRNQDISADLFGAVLQTMTEHGDVARVVQEAMQNDGVIDGNERLKIKREIRQARQALQVFENTLDKVVNIKAVD